MSSTPRSSFQKKGAVKKTRIKGTSPSIHNSQLLISSGIPSFDNLIGGGIPVGSLVLINEDEYGMYAKVMLKYFLAEGLVSEHAAFFCSEDVDVEEMIQTLPAPVDSQLDDTNDNEVVNKKMTVAWRYENLKTVSFSENHRHFGHYFDLSRTMDGKLIENSDITLYKPNTGSSCGSFKESAFYTLLKEIQKKLEKGLYFAKQANSERKILRVALFHMNSSLWQFDDNSESQRFFLTFLYSLRALIRNAYATCFLTLPFSRHKKDLMDKCIHLSDISIELQSFNGTEIENLAPYKDYHGFFVIQKLAAINCLTSYNPQASNFAFKLRRKKFVIEGISCQYQMLIYILEILFQTFYLPPELDDSTEREQDDSSVLSCSSAMSKKLAF